MICHFVPLLLSHPLPLPLNALYQFLPKRWLKEKKVPTKHENISEANRVAKNLITPTTTNPNVPETVSTVASSVSSFGSPLGTVFNYDYHILSDTLPDSLKPKSDNSNWMNEYTNLKCYQENSSCQLQQCAPQMRFAMGHVMDASTCLKTALRESMVSIASR